MHNPKLLPNLKQPPMLASINYPDYKPQLKTCTHPNPPILHLGTSLTNPLNHIKPPKPIPLHSSTVDYPYTDNMALTITTLPPSPFLISADPPSSLLIRTSQQTDSKLATSFPIKKPLPSKKNENSGYEWGH